MRTISEEASALANDFSWVYQVFQDGFLNGFQGTAAWADTVVFAVAVEGLFEHGTLGNDDNVVTTVEEEEYSISKHVSMMIHDEWKQKQQTATTTGQTVGRVKLEFLLGSVIRMHLSRYPWLCPMYFVRTMPCQCAGVLCNPCFALDAMG